MTAENLPQMPESTHRHGLCSHLPPQYVAGLCSHADCIARASVPCHDPEHCDTPSLAVEEPEFRALVVGFRMVERAMGGAR